MTGEGPGPNLGLREVSRVAAFAEGPPRISRRAVWLLLAAAAVIGIGGALADRLVPGSTAVAPQATGAVATASGRPSIAAFVGLRAIAPAPAPPIALVDQHGVAFSWKQTAGRPVLLTFLGLGCGGICPVVLSELRRCEAELSGRGIDPAIVIVNADPEHLAGPGPPEAGHYGKLAALAGARLLTGPIGEMQAVWRSYGVTIEVDRQSGALAYTDVIYLLDASGRLRLALTPFADESRAGNYSLPADQSARFASAMAGYVESLRT